MQNPVILANHLYHVGAAQTQDLRDFLLATLGSQTGFNSDKKSWARSSERSSQRLP